jgi:predicted NBD/HSP70 family sugar kinase
MKRTGDGSLLRKVNQSAILETIREHGPISRSDVARSLLLSPATVTRIVNDLLEQQLVRESGSSFAPYGRRPVLLEFNPRASLIIGVYVHRDMLGAVSDLNGEILERRAVPSVPGEAGVERLIGLIKELHQVAAEYGPPVRGVGIGAPSVVTYRDGMVMWAPSLDWRRLPLKARVEQAVGLRVFVENEVNLIALGESWRGAGQDVGNLVCISLGPGIGAGIVLNGLLYRGTHNAAGEVGYILPGTDFLGHSYDDYGCLEGLAGCVGIAQRAGQLLASGQPSILRDRWTGGETELTADAVLQAARQGDALALGVVDQISDYLSLVVANAVCVLDPDRIVITGDLVNHADLFVKRIQRRLSGALPHMPDLVVSELRMDAAVLGAVAMALFETDGGLFVHQMQA